MQSKLTLRMDDSLIKAAKEYSKKHDKSLSQLVSNYLLSITHGNLKHHPNEMPPITRSLKGILRGKKISEKDYQKHIEGEYR